jgi:hypothetical protein
LIASYFNYLGICDLCLKNCLTQGILLNSPAYSSPGVTHKYK